MKSPFYPLSLLVIASGLALSYGSPMAMEKAPASMPPIQSDAMHSPAYQRLAVMLAQYQTLAEKGGWPTLPSGPKIEPGATDDRIPILRDILYRMNDLKEDDSDQPTLYDAVLLEAVEHFQLRHGLTEDGVIGKETLIALNTPVEKRITQIEATMKRLEEFSAADDRYILVNIPEYMLRAFSDGTLAAQMKVIVGTPKDRTPIFTKQMTYVSFNPHWGVPIRIAAQEMLPKIIENPEFFHEQDFALYEIIDGERVEIDPITVDWTQYNKDHFPFLLRQRPGKGNALGKIKFGLKNSNDIYLHDTSNPKLFAKDIRALSHGCMRVEKPYELAQFVVTGKKNFTPEKLDKLYNGEESDMVSIPALPVYVVYWTAWANEDGTIHFRKDIYGMDK